MYIAPQSNIRILKDVPLDITYNHTLYWESESSQSAYFISKQKYNLTNQSYQRVNKGTMRVNVVADNLYDCNYLMFQNTGFGNKWFYCFIKSVEYVNNEVSEITYELDSMQTWYFNFTVEDSFVEREHSITDNIGDNILPEPVELGEYTFNDYNNITSAASLSDMAVFIVSKGDSDKRGSYLNRIYSGCTIDVYLAEDFDAINNKIAGFNDAPENLVSVYMAPVVAVHSMFPSLSTGGMTINDRNPDVVNFNYNVSIDKLTGSEFLDGYKPKNKKLYTYPYNFISITNGQGQNLNLRYEYFYNGIPDLNISIQIVQPVRCILRAVNYKDSNNNYRGVNNSETLILDGFPTCAVTNDYYMAWLAQQGSVAPAQSAANIAGSFIGGTLISGGNPIIGLGMAVASGISTVASALSEGYKASIHADAMHGSITTNGFASDKMQSFFGGRCSVNGQYAQIIDDFFTMYGYACKRVKRPTYNYRPHWNYVKTIGCNLVGSIPCDEMNHIAQIFDNGITFWKNPSEVGNYLLDNSPQSGD